MNLLYGIIFFLKYFWVFVIYRYIISKRVLIDIDLLNYFFKIFIVFLYGIEKKIIKVLVC